MIMSELALRREGGIQIDNSDDTRTEVYRNADGSLSVTSALILGRDFVGKPNKFGVRLFINIPADFAERAIEALQGKV